MEPYSLCGGEIEEKEVEVIKKAEEKVVVVKDMPAWVCKQCGEKQVDELEKFHQQI
jgi:YgiT-type zinc finger domain-containing protein